MVAMFSRYLWVRVLSDTTVQRVGARDFSVVPSTDKLYSLQ